jgi:hypothetical protein
MPAQKLVIDPQGLTEFAKYHPASFKPKSWPGKARKGPEK